MNREYMGLISWLIFVLWVGLSPWIDVPYSDTFAIFFPVSIIFLYVLSTKGIGSLLKWTGIGFLTFFGYYIKPTVIIVLIAIIIIEIGKLFHDKAKNIGIRCLCCLVVVLSGFIVSLIPSTIEKVYFNGVNNEGEFTITHFIMMGLNNDADGCYKESDVVYSRSFATVAERQAANIDVIKERLKEYGVTGLIKHMAKKALVNFNDGTFTWEREGTFYDQIIEKDNGAASLLRNLFYRSGKYQYVFVLCEQTIWIFVFTVMMGVIFCRKSLENNQLLIMLTVIGLALFLMIFESRARYLYGYSPIIILCSMTGLKKIQENITRGYLKLKEIRKLKTVEYT